MHIDFSDREVRAFRLTSLGDVMLNIGSEGPDYSITFSKEDLAGKVAVKVGKSFFELIPHDVFTRAYVNKDGSEISIDSLPTLETTPLLGVPAGQRQYGVVAGSVPSVKTAELRP